ncbi:MAG: c-type cytochrome, partial [Verrucomicrobiota bacterium]
PGKAEGVRSVDLLLRFGKLEELEALLHREGSPGNPIVEAVGLSGHRNRFELLEKWLADESLPGSLRAKALKAVGNTGPGAKQLLRLAADGKIPAELKFAAGSVLFASPDPKVAEAAEAHFTRPKTVSEEALPPIHELVKMEGTLSSGKMVFGQICIACHQVGDQGLDYGPALTEIGNKLAKEALYTAILDPNEAISFGYEGFTVKTKDGTELSGFIASDTADQLSLKLPGGLKVDIPKGDIQKKTALPISLMPANLQASLTTQQLVDLVAYLASLKGSK